MLKSFFYELPDKRRAQGKQYKQGDILLLAVLSMLCGANSYRQIASLIIRKYKIFNKELNLNWKKMPAYTTIRNIIKSISAEDLEKVFREYNSKILEAKNIENTIIAFDGKVVKGSFDNFNDQDAIQILSAFLVEEKIILAHKDIPKKTSEIPAVIELIEELELKNCIFTADALHCQKKL